jgi:hypothetical protein
MIAPGATFGSWKVAALDPTGKRATCLCSCGTARQIAIDALLDGSSQGCGGCKATPRPRAVAGRPSAEIVAEFANRRRRHRGAL